MNRVDVIAYFGDDPTRAYQLLQWLPVLEKLSATSSVAVVTRDPDTARLIAGRTLLPVHEAVEFSALVDLYERLDPAVALYCNNGMRNFQSLLQPRTLHVHINHGESDKMSMVSNNAKAYDRVFVAGEAAVQRHRAGLMEFDDSRLVRIGRPQLDLRPEPVLPPTDRRTVLYAPTWEGDADYNDYTSVDVLGSRIVRTLLDLENTRVVYKPHPKVTTSLTPEISGAHQQILAMMATAAAADPAAGHLALCQADILAVFAGCDAMITDVSSVGLDWLYLQTDKPIFITDPYGDPERLRTEVPVSRCSDVVHADNVDDLHHLVAERLEHDEHRIARTAMRHHYFDDHRVGESTLRFLESVSALVALRDDLVAHHGPDDEAATA